MSKLVCILKCAMKDTVWTWKVNREREIEGIFNSGNSGQNINMYVGSNGFRYIICQDPVWEGSLSVRLWCVGGVEC